MKLHILTEQTKAFDCNLRGAMFRQRAEVFYHRLEWTDVRLVGDGEMDGADQDPRVAYLVTVDEAGLVGSCRMLPMDGSALLAGPLRHYLSEPVDPHANAYELSRLAPATDPEDPRHGRSFALLNTGALVWCLENGIREIYGVTEPKLIGIVASLGARVTIEGPLIHYAPGKAAFAFKFPVDAETLRQAMAMQRLSAIPRASLDATTADPVGRAA